MKSSSYLALAVSMDCSGGGQLLTFSCELDTTDPNCPAISDATDVADYLESKYGLNVEIIHIIENSTCGGPKVIHHWTAENEDF